MVGFSWDGADERKMRASFDFGRAGFGRFVDLSAVAEGLGYDQVGLATLTHRVLGAALPKLRSVGFFDVPMLCVSAAWMSMPSLTLLPAELCLCAHARSRATPSHVCADCESLVPEPAGIGVPMLPLSVSRAGSVRQGVPAFARR